MPSGYIPVRSRTFNNYILIRSLVRSYSEADVRAGDDLVKKISVYPLSKAAKRPPQLSPSD